jgi:diguanylate cyclase (GGDEF)-like protein
MSILLVDDSKDERLLIQTFLTSAGYQVLTADSVDTAFQHLTKSLLPGNPPVELILLDIVMPRVDGLEVCQRIKAVPQLQDIPIIMLSGKTESGFIQLAFSKGGAEYLRKPVIKLELLTRVRETLRYRKVLQQQLAKEREVTDLEARVEAAERRDDGSKTDELTGLLSRRHAEALLNAEWGRLRTQQNPLSVILLSVDGLKHFNDTYGYQTGNECLRRVAQGVADAVQGTQALVARYGGPQFLIGLPGIRAAHAERLADVLRERVEALELGVTSFVGIATTVPGRNACLADLIAQAQGALAQMRSGGKLL